jgi:hypothetical protein
MARKIDLSKPLSKEDIVYLRQRHHQSYVDRMVALAGGKAEETPEEPEGGESTESTESGSENGGEDLIGDTGSFDPGEHTADEVTKYLKTVNEEEKARVLAAEADGKGRSTILNA